MRGLDVECAGPEPRECKPGCDSREKTKDRRHNGCCASLARPEECKDHRQNARTGDDGTEVRGPVVSRTSIFEHYGEACHEGTVENYTPVAYLKSLAVGGVGVDVGAEEIKGYDAANSDHGRRYCAGNSHEDKNEQTSGGTRSEERSQNIGHH